MTAVAPDALPTTGTRQRPRRLTARILTASLLLAASAAAIIHNAHVRAFEARLTTWLLSPLTPSHVDAATDRFFVWVSPEHLVAIRVTLECTVLVIGLPLTLLALGALTISRISVQRVLLATTAMWAIVILTNTIRLAMIGWATQTWGVDPGYTISHQFVSTAIGAAGFIAGAATFLLILGSANLPTLARRKRHRIKR